MGKSKNKGKGTSDVSSKKKKKEKLRELDGAEMEELRVRINIVMLNALQKAYEFLLRRA